MCSGIGWVLSGRVASCSFRKPSKCRLGCRTRHFSHSFPQQLIWVKAMLWLPEQDCDFENTGGCFLFCLRLVVCFFFFFLNLLEQFKNTHTLQEGLACQMVGNDPSTEEPFCASLIVICSSMYCFSSLNELQKLTTSSLEAFNRDICNIPCCRLEKGKVMKRPVHNHETKSFKPLSNRTDHNAQPDSVTAFPSERCVGAVRSHLLQNKQTL